MNVSISKMKKIIDDNEGNGVLLDGDLAWIYDSIGQAEQGIGLLDSAIAAFSVSRQMAGLAARDGRFSQKELAWIYNDAAGPSIRKREYGEAKRFLCKSVATFKGIGDSTDRGLLSASLNLAVLLRELGEWGSSESLLESITEGIGKTNSVDPLRGDFAIIRGQTQFYMGQSAEAMASFAKGEEFYQSSFEKMGANARRLGRVHQFRELFAIYAGDWGPARAEAGQALMYFEACIWELLI